MSNFSDYGVDSGKGIYEYLLKQGLTITSVSAIDNSQNYVLLPDKTTFNWKSREGQIRVNCTKGIMQKIRSKTSLVPIDNGVGDPTRKYSFLLNTYKEFADLVLVLKE